MLDRAVSLNAVIETIKNQYNEHDAFIPTWLRIGDLHSIDLPKWASEHGYIIVDKDVWEDTIPTQAIKEIINDPRYKDDLIRYCLIKELVEGVSK